MYNLSEAVKGGTVCLSKAGLAVGSAGATVDIAAPNGAGVDFAIDGKIYHKADTANNAITAAAVQAVSSSCLYLVQINASGTVSTVKGTAVLTANVGNEPLNWPDPAADNCPIGAFRIDTDSTHTYTAGTTENGAAGITDTYYDLFAIPPAPLTA